MPFDASGNFTRVYNFQQDAANGIKILAARVDGEFDNIATGMNAVFFRDGRVPMQADLRMNINGITGLKDGALGSPALKFNTDPNTGVYLPGLNQYGIQVNSVQRGVFTTAGFDVTGNFTASGTIMEGGTLLSSKYAPIAGPSFTGTSTFGGNIVQNGNFLQHKMVGSDGLKGWRLTSTVNGASDGGLTVQHSTDNFVANFTNNVQFNADGTSQFGNAISVTGLGTFTGGVAMGANAGGSLTNYVNGASGTARGFGFLTAGAYAADITLQSDNGTIKHNSSAAHRFDVNGAQTFTVGSNSAYINGTKLLLQHDSTSGYIRAETGDLYIGSAGVNVLKVQSNGTLTQLVNGGSINNAGGGGSYNVGYYNSRGGGGQAGYHMYNGGAVTEWIMYQPAPAVSHELRIAMGAAGSFNDRWKIGQDGNVYTLGNQGVNSELWVGMSTSTGVIRFAGGAGTPNYLYYDGTQFQLSKSLTVGGNISSSSDIRLKSGIRDLSNGMDMVRQLQPKRFTMYGKSDFGFIAQEALPVVPEVVSVDTKGYMSIDYARLTAVLAGAVQNLDERLRQVEGLLAL